MLAIRVEDSFTFCGTNTYEAYPKDTIVCVLSISVSWLASFWNVEIIVLITSDEFVGIHVLFVISIYLRILVYKTILIPEYICAV